MSATFSQAYDDIAAVFFEAWKDTGHAVEWPNRGSIKPLDSDTWARVTIRHDGGGERTLANADGIKRYERTGTVTVQIFTPQGQGLEEGQRLAKMIADNYEGRSTEHGVWFQECRLREVGQSGAWYQMNFLAQFNYDEVK